jgi:CBS domain-containing protein
MVAQGRVFDATRPGAELVKRLTINEAFAVESATVEGDGEAVVLAVRGGEVAAGVPAGTSDEQVIDGAARIRGVLRLENERVLTFEIRRGANGASFKAESAHLDHERAAAAAGRSNTRGSRFLGGPQTAGEIMTRDVLTTSPDMLVEDIAKKLAFHNISGMPVEDWDGKVIGIVSEADVIGKIGVTISDVMSSEVISVPRTATIEEIASLLAERKIKRVPVLEGGALIGIVSRADIVRALAERA